MLDLKKCFIGPIRSIKDINRSIVDWDDNVFGNLIQGQLAHTVVVAPITERYFLSAYFRLPVDNVDDKNLLDKVDFFDKIGVINVSDYNRYNYFEELNNQVMFKSVLGYHLQDIHKQEIHVVYDLFCSIMRIEKSISGIVPYYKFSNCIGCKKIYREKSHS